jgi:hypothetical protein
MAVSVFCETRVCYRTVEMRLSTSLRLFFSRSSLAFHKRRKTIHVMCARALMALSSFVLVFFIVDRYLQLSPSKPDDSYAKITNNTL